MSNTSTSANNHNLKNKSLASAQDNRTELNLLAPQFDKNYLEEKPSDIINFSSMNHNLVWKMQEGDYDNLMKNSYFSLSDKAIKSSRNENENVNPQNMLRQMKNIAGERNVPHYLNYPSEGAEGTISNQMIKERNFQKYMENPSHVRDMIADAFLLKIANDGSISEMDREQLIQEAENGKGSSELHDMMARMTYNNPQAYKAFQKILLESEKLRRDVNAGDDYGFVSDTYNKYYSNMAKDILQAKENFKDADFYAKDGEHYVKNDEVQLPTSTALNGRDINNISEMIRFLDKTKKELAAYVNVGTEDISIELIKDIIITEQNENIIPPEVINKIKIEIKKIDTNKMSKTIKEEELKTIQNEIEMVYDFANNHDINQKLANEIMYEMHQAGRFDQTPFFFLDVPIIGDVQDDGTAYTKEAVQEIVDYNTSLIQEAVYKVLGEDVGEDIKQGIVKNISNDLYAVGNSNGHNKGAYYDAVKGFVDKSRNEPSTMTVYSNLNSVATTIMRDALYNELMSTKFENNNNKIYEELKNVGLKGDKGKTVHIAEKIRTGSYEETLAKQEELKDDVATLMNKATLFSKVAKGEMNAEQTASVIDETAIFRDMKEDERDAIKDVTNDIFDAKNEIDMSKYYDIDKESRSRFLDDIVTDNVFSYIEESDSGMRFGIKKLFRNNKALAGFVRCGQSGSVKDRNAESVANNLKSCMENYRKELDDDRDRKEQMAVRVLSSPFGAMNGLVVFMIVLQQLIADMEFRRSRKALSEMHHDMLNKLAFRRASPDLQTEKARAALLSADANRGVTTTTMSHAVADKYKSTLAQEKLSSTIFNKSMNGINIFKEDSITLPKFKDDGALEEVLEKEINKFRKDKDVLESQLKLLKSDADVIKRASLIDENELNERAEEVYDLYQSISDSLEFDSTPNKEELVRDKKKLEKQLAVLQEQGEIVRAALKLKANGVDVLENTDRLKNEIEEIDNKLNTSIIKMKNIKDREHMQDISQDNIETLMAKSEILKDMGESLASQKKETLSKSDRKNLSNIIESREKLAIKMIQESAFDNSLTALKEAFSQQFDDSIKKSGINKSIEAINLKRFSKEITRIMKNTDNGYDDVQYNNLINKIENSSGVRVNNLQKEQDRLIKDTFNVLKAEIKELSEDDGANEHILNARKKDLETLKEYAQDVILVRELKKQNEIMKNKMNVIINSVNNTNSKGANAILTESRNKILKDFEESHISVITNAKDILKKFGIELNFEDNSIEKAKMDRKSDLIHEARNTGIKGVIDNVISVIKNISTLKEAKIGDTQSSISLSNRTQELFSMASDIQKKAISDSSGVKIREFENKTQDNMTSMLVMTDERMIMLESARQGMLEEGNIIESDIINQQLKNYVSSSVSYDIGGVENWGKNAKNKMDLMESGISAQEGQRQTRAAMLR